MLARVKTHLLVHTLKRQLQAQNAQLQQEIQERQHAEKSLHLLLRAVSHDLRNPVTGMLMVLRNLIQTSPSGSHDTDNSSDALPSTIAVPRSILDRMIESSDRQLKLINSLLEAHAGGAQQPELQKRSVHLSELVSNIIQDIQPIVEKSQASIENLISSKLPPVCVDPDQLWRVFENLVVNALKHNPPGLEIVIDADVQDGEVRCCVNDNGVGISPEQCDRLFEPYSRGNNAHHTHGLGLGLYLCRQIVYAHGGDIGIKSQLGEGSTFWFTLPLTSSESGHAELFTQN
ncbi:MAG: sensor histidine kinase [Elainellaceae cyanobacterium]